MFNIAVLTSGMSRGSNLKAMAEYFQQNNLPVKIVFVIRTKDDAPLKDVCTGLNVACHFLPYKNRAKFEDKVLYLIDYHNIHLVALAGFLKLLSPDFINNAGVPILNIHPSLLPGFGGKDMYGAAVHKAVFDAGEKVSGATVHLVNEVYDDGQIVAQKQIDVSHCGSPDEIAKSVLKIEHQLYGRAIWEYLQKLYS